MDIHEEKTILGIWCTIIIFILAYEIAFAYMRNQEQNDLIIVLSHSKEKFKENKYYQSICPYTSKKCETFTLPYHDLPRPFELWNLSGMESIVEMSNKKIEEIKKKHNYTRLILSGISRGGYLAAMHQDADIYLLFSPVVKWSELKEFNSDGPDIDITNLQEKRVFGFVNDKDTRINGNVVVDFFNKICNKCLDSRHTFIVNEGTEHTVPINIFKRAAVWL